MAKLYKFVTKLCESQPDYVVAVDEEDAIKKFRAVRPSCNLDRMEVIATTDVHVSDDAIPRD